MIYERIPKFGLHEGIHSIGAYPRSKSAVGTLIPGLSRRETPLYKTSALILGHPHMCWTFYVLYKFQFTIWGYWLEGTPIDLRYFSAFLCKYP